MASTGREGQQVDEDGEFEKTPISKSHRCTAWMSTAKKGSILRQRGDGPRSFDRIQGARQSELLVFCLPDLVASDFFLMGQLLQAVPGGGELVEFRCRPELHGSIYPRP